MTVSINNITIVSSDLSREVDGMTTQIFAGSSTVGQQFLWKWVSAWWVTVHIGEAIAKQIEPTANIDPSAEERLVNLLKLLDDKLTIITVSHDLAFVSRTRSKVICVNRCVHVHPTTELTQDHLRKLYGFDVSMVQHDHEHLDSHGGHQHGWIFYNFV